MNKQIQSQPRQKKLSRQKKWLNNITARFDRANTFFVKDLSDQIAQIRDEETVEYIILLAMLAANIAAVNAQIDAAAKASVIDSRRIYKATIDDVLNDSRYSFAVRELPKETRQSLYDYASVVEAQTAAVTGRMTRANNVSQTYQQAANKAVVARKSGFDDYKGLTRQTVREFARDGLRVTGADGRNRDIVSAVQKAVLDGIYQIRQHTNEVLMAELGFDAVEISVHDNPAPDHEPIQGRVFMRGEYEKLQNHEEATDIDGMKYPAQIRAIGELNCRHLAFPFSTQHSKRRYTPKMLREKIARNERGCEINGKHYTLYEARQLANRLAAEKERQERVLQAAEIVKDDILKNDAATRINTVEQQLADAARAVENAQNATEVSRKYREITDEWVNSGKKGIGKAEDMPMVTVKGVTYHVHGKDVRFEYDSHEKAVGDMIAKKTGREVYMMPKVNNPGSVNTPDNMIDGEYYDLKTLTQKAKENTLFNRAKSAKRQATNVILDITNGEVSDTLLATEVDKIYWSYNTIFIDKVVIVRDMNILYVYQRA